MKVPFCDLTIQHKKLESEINSSIKRVINNSAFILGDEVNSFEQEFSNYLGVNHFIGTSSGTSALIVALKALDIGINDEVILPAMSFYATAEAVAFIGAKPAFVDIDPSTCNIDINQIEEKITNKTKLILPVHLYGYPANLDEIIKIAKIFSIKILTDCAHATGASYYGNKVGAIEDIAAFSFYPSKNLGCIGEAGGIATNNKKGDFPVAEKLANYTLSLPCYPYMKDEQVDYVCQVLKSLI